MNELSKKDKHFLETIAAELAAEIPKSLNQRMEEAAAKIPEPIPTDLDLILTD